MGLKAGWLALFLFVWIIGTFLGSTFDYQDTAAASGMSYSTGTATFTPDSAEVIGAGTTWSQALMAGGLIKSNTDDVWYKILSVNSTTNLTMTAVYAQDGGAGQAYTMQASPGWAGSGTGGYGRSPTTKIEYLMNVTNVVQRNPILGSISFVSPNPNYFKTLFEVVTWQWSFLYNADGTMAYGLFYWVFILPFVVMGIFSLILLVYGILTGNLTL